MSTPVTTDLAVLKGWPTQGKNGKPKPATSLDVATALGLTVFQITARLKGMEGRGFTARNENTWFLTEQGLSERANPSPSVSGTAKTMRAKDSSGVHSGPPDDSNVPRMRLTKHDWAPSDASVLEARTRLPDVQGRLDSYTKEQLKDDLKRREYMALQTEVEHCKSVIAMGRKGKWTSRTEHTGHGAHTVYIAPDHREYVHASAYETADLLIEAKVAGIPPSRLRLYSTSAAAKAVKKAAQTDKDNAERQAVKDQEARNARILEEERTKEERVLAEAKPAKQLPPKVSGRKVKPPVRPAPVKKRR